jgi:hypothetical protein
VRPTWVQTTTQPELADRMVDCKRGDDHSYSYQHRLVKSQRHQSSFSFTAMMPFRRALRCQPVATNAHQVNEYTRPDALRISKHSSNSALCATGCTCELTPSPLYHSPTAVSQVPQIARLPPCLPSAMPSMNEKAFSSIHNPTRLALSILVIRLQLSLPPALLCAHPQ